MNRRHKSATLPTVPGWYQGGPDHLRYFNGVEWTEQIRPLPQFTDIPGLHGLDFKALTPPSRTHRIRRVFAIVALAIITISIMSQALGLSVAANSTKVQQQTQLDSL